MDDFFEKYVENLVSDCLKGAKFAYLPEREKQEIATRLRDYFYSQTIDTLVDQLSDEQVSQIQSMDANDPKTQQLMSEFAASIPGFAFVLEEKLKKEMDEILQTGQVPS